jgi:hypothetical protein
MNEGSQSVIPLARPGDDGLHDFAVRKLHLGAGREHEQLSRSDHPRCPSHGRSSF